MVSVSQRESIHSASILFRAFLSTRLSHECRFCIATNFSLQFLLTEAMNAWSLLHSHSLMATPIPPRPLMSPDRLIAFSWYPTSSTPTWAAWRTTSITSRSACCSGATRYDFQHLFRTDSRYKRALYQSRFSYSCTCARSICLWKIRLQALHEYVSIFFPNS